MRSRRFGLLAAVALASVGLAGVGCGGGSASAPPPLTQLASVEKSIVISVREGDWKTVDTLVARAADLWARGRGDAVSMDAEGDKIRALDIVFEVQHRNVQQRNAENVQVLTERSIELLALLNEPGGGVLSSPLDGTP